jgi:hypothetical protein
MSIILALVAVVALAAAILFWRKSMNLQESLDALVKSYDEVVEKLQIKVGTIPYLIKEAKEKAVADYIAANPPSLPPGPVTIDGVTYDSLILAMQALTAHQKTISINADGIENFFESEKVHDNPWWPNDPPTEFNPLYPNDPPGPSA